jgi:hypothetical protein
MKKEADAVSRSLEETTATNQSPAVDSHDVSLARSLHAAYKGVGWGGTAERIAADKPVSSEARTEPARSANPCPRCEVLKKALERLRKASAQTRSSVEFSLNHSIRACAHQEFIAEDREELAELDAALAEAKDALEEPNV